MRESRESLLIENIDAINVSFHCKMSLRTCRVMNDLTYWSKRNKHNRTNNLDVPLNTKSTMLQVPCSSILPAGSMQFHPSHSLLLTHAKLMKTRNWLRWFKADVGDPQSLAPPEFGWSHVRSGEFGLVRQTAIYRFAWTYIHPNIVYSIHVCS